MAKIEIFDFSFYLSASYRNFTRANERIRSLVCPLVTVGFLLIRFEIILSSNERFSRRAKFDGMYLNKNQLWFLLFYAFIFKNLHSITNVYMYVCMTERWTRLYYMIKVKSSFICQMYHMKYSLLIKIKLKKKTIASREWKWLILINYMCRLTGGGET